ncbi:hypothetical protein [Treponema sp. Marseille-Q4523]|uniref:hypothetical protein n=1 Tax=Treponema sp. Marseille-Q4523 TaxID=2810610 RepID=UPI00195FDA3F|nr:hypothetical protein [Treponema sp. Marseille-Q4523]MBM7022663.1 hypothetical protein [Treponema sp. Marseille-Q4523]
MEDSFESAVCFKTCTLDRNDCAFLWRKLAHLSHESMEPCERFETFLLMTDKKKKEATKK